MHLQVIANVLKIAPEDLEMSKREGKQLLSVTIVMQTGASMSQSDII